MKKLTPKHAKYQVIQNLLQKIYGIKADSICEFYSFEDENYFIQINSIENSKQEYTLKIMNAEASQNQG